MSYAQFGYAAFTTPTTQLMVGTGGAPAPSMPSPCCGGGGESGRSSSGLPPGAGESQGAVCSLPATYDSRLLSTYPRLGPSALYPAGYAEQAYPNFESSAFYPSLGSAYGMKDAGDPWRGIAPSASYYYDPSLAAYGYGGLDFNGARRKNVTRDSTSTLKAWLNEHRKNPYPTKGEKIMLAIITKMTLTQVSTWFANARRRLKKENKMTWEPRNKMDADDVKDFDDDDDDDDDGKGRHETTTDRDERGLQDRAGDRSNLDHQRREDLRIGSEAGRCDSEEDSDDAAQRMTPCDNSIDGSAHFSAASALSPPRGHYDLLPHRSKLAMPPHDGHPAGGRDPPLLPPSEFTPTDSSSSPNLPDIQALIRDPVDKARGAGPSSSLDMAKMSCGDPGGNGSSKPKIWSLADTATSKSPGPAAEGPGPTVADMLGHCGWFSVNPYHHQSAGLQGYHHHGAAAFAVSSSGGGGACGAGFAPPQTDTPPQTPPNMKLSTALPLGASGYGQGVHLYQAANGMCSGGGLSSAMQAGKAGGMYHIPSGNRPYRTDTTPEDYSMTGGQFRPTAIQ